MRLIAGLALVFGLAATTDAAARCRFELTPEFLERVVVAQGRGWLGEHAADWELENPLVTVRGRTVRLLVNYRRVDVQDPPEFVILIDDCGRGRVRSGFQAWDVALGLRKPTEAERRSPSFVE